MDEAAKGCGCWGLLGLLALPFLSECWTTRDGWELGLILLTVFLWVPLIGWTVVGIRTYRERQDATHRARTSQAFWDAQRATSAVRTAKQARITAMRAELTRLQRQIGGPS